MAQFKYEIGIRGAFESAHYLYDYHGPGKNEKLHGHSYRAEIYVGSNELQNGISVDFLDVRKEFDLLIKELDHVCINTLDAFKEKNPTAENLAEYFFEKIKDHIPENARITRVQVWEGPENHATYYPGV